MADVESRADGGGDINDAERDQAAQEHSVRSSAGALSYVWLRDLPAAASWTAASSSFTVPAGTVSASVFHLIARNGTLDMQTSLSSVMVTLCLTDFLAPYPDAMIHVHNLGGNIPYEVERMDHRCLLDTPHEELPSARFRRSKVYVDCNSFGPSAIEAGVRLYGAERIVCGTDGSEFGCQWTSKALADANISEEAREQILHRNARDMLAHLVKLPVAATRERVAA